MMKSNALKTTQLMMALALGLNAHANPNMKGQEITHQSPNGKVEKCIITNRAPEGSYSEGDADDEKKFCDMDFYSNSLALCPKTWSTSAATIVNTLNGSNMTQSQAEQQTCAQGKSNPLKSVAKFKQTMNQSGTSALFSKSSLLYYHMSRYLDTTIDVPVAVMRTMDKNAHYDRVTSKARPTATMNRAAWDWMKKALPAPNTFPGKVDLFTPDLEQIYGVLLKDKGERYGAEINSLRKSSGYDAQNDEIQTTPSFMALASDGDLSTAIDTGIRRSFQNAGMRDAFRGEAPSKVQMVLWMNEMSEMAVLDYIFSQQDRVGNIDFRWYWMFVDDKGKFRKAKLEAELPLRSRATILANVEKTYAANDESDNAKDARMYQAIKQFNPVLVQKTMIGDNDAGGRTQYANFTKRRQFIQKFKHLNADLYKKIIKMDTDFKTQGVLHNYFKDTFALEERQFNQLINQTSEVATILREKCQAGQLKFDLVSHKKAVKNEFTETTLNCVNP